MVWAAAFTLYSGADSAFVYDSLRATGRERDYTKLWGRARAIQAVGAILGLGLGAPLAHFTTLWVPVVASGGLMAVAWIVSFSFKEPPRFESTDDQPGYFAVVKDAFGVAFGKPSVRILMLLTAGVMGVGVSMIILQQPFLSDHEMPIWSFGVFLTPGQLLSMVAALVTYRVLTLLGVSRIIILMPLVVMTTAVGLGAIDYVAAFAFYPLTTTMFAMSHVVISDYLNRRIPSANRATILSIHNMIFSLAVAGMEPLLGWLGDTWGLPAAYRAAAIIVAVLSGPLLALCYERTARSKYLARRFSGPMRNPSASRSRRSLPKPRRRPILPVLTPPLRPRECGHHSTHRRTPRHVPTTLGLALALGAALALTAACGGDGNPYHEDLDGLLSEAYACATDDEMDADDKTDCLVSVIGDLNDLEDLSDEDQSIIRRFLVLMEPGTRFITIGEGIIELRQEINR